MSNPNYQDAISEIVQKMFEQKFLTADGVDLIAQLKDNVAKADAEILRLTEQAAKMVKDHSAKVASLTEELNEVKARAVEHAKALNEWSERESNLLAREKAIHLMDKQAAVAEAEARALRFSLSTVFAPNTVRSSVQNNTNRNYPGPINNGYQQQVSESSFEHHNEQTTEGYQPPADGAPAPFVHAGHKPTL